MCHRFPSGWNAPSCPPLSLVCCVPGRVNRTGGGRCALAQIGGLSPRFPMPISSYPAILLFNPGHLQIYSYLGMCLFWAFHINELTLWPLWLAPLTEQHVFEGSATCRVSVLPSLSWPSRNSVWMGSCCVYSLAGGHLGCCHLCLL